MSDKEKKSSQPTSLNLPPELHQRVRMRAVTSNQKIGKIIEQALAEFLDKPAPPRTLIERTMAAMLEPEVPERYLPLMAELAKVLDNPDPEDQDFLVRRLVLDWWERRVLKTEREKP